MPQTRVGLQHVPPAHLWPAAQHAPLHSRELRQQFFAVVHVVPPAQHLLPQICRCRKHLKIDAEVLMDCDVLIHDHLSMSGSAAQTTMLQRRFRADL